ncbi:hypothetical protein CW751_08330 [Brumimicrobium salinarum]|uniref:Uncharacterized protein n=1 Tax=Brumimicrobium salinarum TaxID=2058658 RepID=A0A2I0R2F8_9FLAO|nr:hypothetical protein [Brumimicrobium salinarum]PKR80768.1 hypothetical protein CW751_08330 [Brumimicrobium salinarum]
MLFWQIRNYNITHEIVSLNPIYYPENSHSSFRPTHQALWNLSKGWGEIGANFHDYMGTFWSGAMRGVTAQENTREIIDRLPKHIVKELGRERFREMFLNYHQSILHQKNTLIKIVQCLKIYLNLKSLPLLKLKP